MTYLLDTNAFRALMDEHPTLGDRLDRESAQHRIAVPVTVRGEVLFGVERMPSGKRRDEVAQKASVLFASLDVEPVPAVAAEHYARVKRAREQRGVPMDENDLWIA